MNDVSRDEFNGLGQRVSLVDKAQVVCQSRHDAESAAIRKEQERMGDNIEKLFDKMDDVKTSVVAMGVKVTAVIAAAIFVAQLAAPYIQKAVGP